MAQSSNAATHAASNKFTLGLYDVLRKTPGNVFFSPYSLQIALGMTYIGAGGNTAKELQRCLGFPEDKDAMAKVLKSIAGSMQTKSKNVTLNIANAIFVQKDFPLKSHFTKHIHGNFEAEAKSLNFAEPNAAAKEINTYVDKKTNGKITELFSPDAFNALTKLVLVNALYFKGCWRDKFDPSSTFKGDFHLNSQDKVQVDYMTITKKFNAAESETLNASIVEIPYEGDFSMVLLVPNEIEGITRLENAIKDIDLKTLTLEAFSREVNLTMPKFKLEQKMGLVDSLKQLGLMDMFDSNKADFSGITDKADLHVSEVIQKTFIDVNEEGSEAAAATACGVRTKRSMEYYESLVLTVDHPFLFCIKGHDDILFVGSLRAPEPSAMPEDGATEKRSSEWPLFGPSMKCAGF